MKEAPKVFNKIRALLAKAESTEFEHEAQAFAAKAQQLMAAHSIDDAMVSNASRFQDSPMSRLIHIEDPYWSAKGSLLSSIAQANSCECVWNSHAHTVTVFGYEIDVDNVEMLFTVLLIHATKAMTAHGSVQDPFGRSNTRAFRKSFLEAFALRIGERLREASEAVLRAETHTRGEDLLPVLADRKDQVERAVSEAFPKLGIIKRNLGSSVAGFNAGRASANSARLGQSGQISA